jgi:queuine tRNA-ribosyltransferase
MSTISKQSLVSSAHRSGFFSRRAHAGSSMGGSNSRKELKTPELLPCTLDSFSSDDFKAVSYKGFNFEVTKTADTSKARLATITTPHGVVECPNFVFCGTKAAMKSITPDQLRAEGSQIMLSNTYHLMLNPGPEVVDRCGGLQKFSSWNGPMLTDSGGYQIFSMGHGSVSDEIKGRRNATRATPTKDVVTVGATNANPEATPEGSSLLRITEDGATFKSYIDGRIFHLTPESSIEIQQKLGADLIVVLDECTPFHVSKNYTEDSMYRSHRWAVRSLNQFRKFYGVNAGTAGNEQGEQRLQALYGIVQGGVYEDLRKVSCEFINALPVFGIAIGGSLGSSREDMYKVVEFTRAQLRSDRPVHLLGIGGVRDIFHGVRQGIDTFDCVHPTRLARHGGALVTAAFWDEPVSEEERITTTTLSIPIKIEKEAQQMTQRHLRAEARLGAGANNGASSVASAEVAFSEKHIRQMPDYDKVLGQMRALVTTKYETLKQKRQEKSRAKRIIRENISMRRSTMSMDTRPIEAGCQCYTCRNFSRAYIHHLFTVNEMLGPTLVSIPSRNV